MDGRPTPSASSSLTRVASVNRGGGSVKCCSGSIPRNLSVSPASYQPGACASARRLLRPFDLYLLRRLSGSRRISRRCRWRGTYRLRRPCLWRRRRWWSGRTPRASSGWRRSASRSGGKLSVRLRPGTARRSPACAERKSGGSLRGRPARPSCFINVGRFRAVVGRRNAPRSWRALHPAHRPTHASNQYACN